MQKQWATNTESAKGDLSTTSNCHPSSQCPPTQSIATHPANVHPSNQNPPAQSIASHQVMSHQPNQVPPIQPMSTQTNQVPPIQPIATSPANASTKSDASATSNCTCRRSCQIERQCDSKKDDACTPQSKQSSQNKPEIQWPAAAGSILWPQLVHPSTPLLPARLQSAV